ncbi:MAG TPA: hypothetical protein VKY92_00280 [Verrucomicrobiae bacterium]|jgi:hypothetical protein|nr:hypothetical protein [Verrucomicrobiae bacterium]
MKNVIMLVCVATLLGGCSWFGHGESNGSGTSSAGISGVDYGTGRGTTGVSSGAGAGPGITGSDAAGTR